MRFDDTANNENLRTSLGQAFVTDGVEMFPEVKTFGEDNQVKITTKYLIDSQDLNADELVAIQLAEGLAAHGEYEIMSSQKVGPTIADDIKRNSFFAIFGSLIVVFLYILIRFRDWQLV